MYTVDQFLAWETKVWDALIAGDMAADENLLADDFLGVYGSGFAGKSEHVSQLELGPTIAHYELSDARIQVLSDDVVLLSYHATWMRSKAGVSGITESMYISSIWRRCGNVWQNVFSQDTPAGS